MKKLLLPLLIVLFAATTAFTTQHQKPVSLTTTYHWFDANGQYLGEFSKDEMLVVCPENTTTVCARAYNDITIVNGEIVPNSAQQDAVFKLP